MSLADTAAVEEPFPIFELAHRFILYDTATITYVRAKYNIAGVLIGGLPQAPQQNVFLGVPLELMPEEARLLCEKGVAHVVDDVKAHKQSFLGRGLGDEERRAYQASLRKQGQAAAGQAAKRTEDRKKAGLTKLAERGDWNDIPEDMFRSPRAPTKKKVKRPTGEVDAAANGDAPNAMSGDDDEQLFAPPKGGLLPQSGLSRTTSNTSVSGGGPEPYAITPATSYPPLTSAPSDDAALKLPDVPPSYPLFKHLHENEYFMAPGLRFGCQYMAYPGDPLRFHSHFLCNGMDWDQEFDLQDLVGGGRLGTGVKKGFLIGGQVRIGEADESGDGQSATDGGEEGVRTFCVEWGGM
ncbi:hypothetical protein LTR08_006955 [Meristemomyces frigidus]|nr:hypothetical protein LTR08_006955 [Meristemomyces frigidus]